MIDLKGNPFYLTDAQEAWVLNTLNALTVEEKLHQMFCVLGDAYSEAELERLAKDGIGGVLFRPVRPAVEIAAHFRTLDGLAKVPLLHASNLEEGGAGASSDGTFFANPMQVAASRDPEDNVRFARCCAAEGAAAGVNWTFSPVSDLDLNPLNPITNCRTYGSDAERVSACTSRFVETVQQSGMAACAKHFPGDGVDYRDQHLHPTYNSLSAADWWSTYGRVYRGMIQKGLLSVMAGHICQPALEMEIAGGGPEDVLPGSLSHSLLTGVLRGQLHFNGVIATDAIIMGGYTMPMARREAIPTTFNAGADMIVFSTDIDEDLAFARAALETGVLPLERVNEALTRILALKARVCGHVQADSIPAEAWKKECAERSVTLVKDLDHLLPISPERFGRIRLMLLGQDRCWDGSIGEMLRMELEKRGFAVERYDPLSDDLHGTRGLASDRLTLGILHYPHASNQTAVRVCWCPKHALEIPRFVHEEAVVFASLANPYHLQDVPRVRTFINCYSATRATIAALVEKLCGESPFLGKNPSDPFCGLWDAKL